MALNLVLLHAQGAGQVRLARAGAADQQEVLPLTREMFLEWFDCELSTMIWDMLKTRIKSLS